MVRDARPSASLLTMRMNDCEMETAVGWSDERVCDGAFELRGPGVAADPVGVFGEL
jgi:hypothetical protein